MSDPKWEVIHGDVLAVLPTLPAASVDCCVTSPPYWGLRDYGVAGQLGLESTPAEYVARMVEVFREVRRVLKDDGTLWLNLGDSYASNTKGDERTPDQLASSSTLGPKRDGLGGGNAAHVAHSLGRIRVEHGLKAKDLVGIPWRVAFALQADGWYLRSDIIWAKPNPMPESIKDRPTKAHEYLFLLSKSERYYYDAVAAAEPAASCPDDPRNRWDRGYDAPPGQKQQKRPGRSGNTERKPATERGCPKDGVAGNVPWEGTTRNRRTVWTIPTEPFPGAHFAVMPTALVKPCVLAGCRPGGIVLDPFTGSGTVGYVALENGCGFVGVELNPAYVEIARERIGEAARAPMLDFGAP